jgi:hypothetical protein
MAITIARGQPPPLGWVGATEGDDSPQFPIALTVHRRSSSFLKCYGSSQLRLGSVRRAPTSRNRPAQHHPQIALEGAAIRFRRTLLEIGERQFAANEQFVERHRLSCVQTVRLRNDAASNGDLPPAPSPRRVVWPDPPRRNSSHPVRSMRCSRALCTAR